MSLPRTSAKELLTSLSAVFILKFWKESDKNLHAFAPSSLLYEQAYLTTRCQDWPALAWFHLADRYPGSALLKRNTSFPDLASDKDQVSCSHADGYSNTRSGRDDITSTDVNKCLTLPVNDILAQDTFQRANQGFWGTSSDGQAWGADAKNSQSFEIINHMGRVTNGNGVYDAILGHIAVNSEVVFSGSLTQYTSSSLGALLRWTDANNLYKMFVGGGQLILLKKVAGVVTVLKTVPFPVKDGVSYTFRYRAAGQLLFARAWPSAQVEPQTWMLMATDNDLPSGYDGIRLVVQAGTTASIASFTETGL